MHHIAIATPNIHPMREFYSKLPGMKLFRDHFYPNTENSLRSSWFCYEGSPIIIMLEKENFSRGFHALVFDLSHISYDKEELKNFLDQKLSIVIDGETEFTFYFLDPDGNRLGYSSYIERSI
ncbi:MAG: VOC family protein [Leptospira sp.]|nr:VOC family protein [Leptospira sp.]